MTLQQLLGIKLPIIQAPMAGVQGAHSQLAACLKSLNLPNFHVIDTLHLTTTMQPAEPNSQGNSKDWENEIHPNRGGYEKLAATWSTTIA